MPEYVLFGEYDERTYNQFVRCAEHGNAPYAVLCADNHLGYSQPIGAAVAYRDLVSVAGVGYDIGCGNMAVSTNLHVGDFDVADAMDAIVDRISFGMGRNNNEPVDHDVLDVIEKSPFAPQRDLIQLAYNQLGTVGSGNHYVNLFHDTDERIWIGVHFGSRGFGHKTASGFLSLAQGGGFHDRAKDGEMDSPPVLLDTNSQLGKDYIKAMSIAGYYARAGREIVVEKVAEIIGAKILEVVHNHHNYAWQETHHGESLWVVRKGCTPLLPGQSAFVGSTMGEDSVILEGVDTKRAANALYSTVHGAGRQMSRSQAAGKFKRKKIDGKYVKVQTKPGKIDFATVKEQMQASGIELRGGGADEAPEAYKRLSEVLKHHAGTYTIKHTLTPLGVAMAGDEYDPYKD